MVDVVKLLSEAQDADDMLARLRPLIPTRGPGLLEFVQFTGITRTYAAQLKHGTSGVPKMATLMRMLEYFAPGYTLGLVRKR